MRHTLLAGALLFFGTALEDLPDSLEAIRKDMTKAQRQGGREGIGADDLIALSDRCFALAEEDEAEAFDALNTVALMSQRTASEEGPELYVEAIGKLIEDFVDDERLASLLMNLGYVAPDMAEQADEWLTTVIEESSNDKVKATAMYTYGGLLGNWPGPDADSSGDDLRKRAIAVLKECSEKYGEVMSLQRKPFKDLCKGNIFELEHLYIGALAPEIEGQDLDGVSFKLSDYRGKVVVIDFWGHW